MRFVHLLFLPVLLLGGCSTPYSPPILAPDNRPFTGLRELLTHNPPPRVVMIHGMCHHDRAWVEESVTGLASGLGVPSSPVELMMDDPQTQVRLYASTLGEKKPFRVYGIVYSETTKTAKQRLCPDVSKPTTVCPQPGFRLERARGNAFAKNRLLDDCFADAVIYFGPSGEQVRKGVLLALQRIAREEGGSLAPAVLISESLGSKVLRDTLLMSNAEAGKEAARPLLDIRTMFLAANQIPLLNLGQAAGPAGAGLVPESPTPAGDVFELLDWLRALRREILGPGVAPTAVPKPVVVAFTDPNDLLSYRLTDAQYGNDYTVVNVAVSNARTWLGLFSNPYTAHTTYLENPEVMSLIVQGHDSPMTGGEASH